MNFFKVTGKKIGEAVRGKYPEPREQGAERLKGRENTKFKKKTHKTE